MKLLTWNINGIRAALRKGLTSKLDSLDLDIIAFQEIKCQDEHMEEIFNFSFNESEDLFGESTSSKKKSKLTTNEDINFIAGYKTYWNCSKARKGYSGTAIMLKNEWVRYVVDELYFLGDDEYDTEGRLTGLVLEIDGNKTLILNGYYPQGGREGRVEYKIQFYKRLVSILEGYRNNGVNIILCGDLNTTITDIDLARPKSNRKNTGCLPHERVALNWLISDEFIDSDKLKIVDDEFMFVEKFDVKKLGLIDGFRYFYPEKADMYTYWDQITSARDRNVGWRIDYWLIDRALEKSIKSCEILSEIMGSDHCPVLLTIKI